MKMLTIFEFAERMNVHKRTLENWIRAGRCPKPIQINQIRRWDSAAIERWIGEGCPAITTEKKKPKRKKPSGI